MIILSHLCIEKIHKILRKELKHTELDKTDHPVYKSITKSN